MHNSPDPGVILNKFNWLSRGRPCQPRECLFAKVSWKRSRRRWWRRRTKKRQKKGKGKEKMPFRFAPYFSGAAETRGDRHVIIDRLLRNVRLKQPRRVRTISRFRKITASSASTRPTIPACRTVSKLRAWRTSVVDYSGLLRRHQF